MSYGKLHTFLSEVHSRTLHLREQIARNEPQLERYVGEGLAFLNAVSDGSLREHAEHDIAEAKKIIAKLEATLDVASVFLKENTEAPKKAVAKTAKH